MGDFNEEMMQLVSLEKIAPSTKRGQTIEATLKTSQILLQ